MFRENVRATGDQITVTGLVFTIWQNVCDIEAECDELRCLRIQEQRVYCVW